VSGMVDKQDYYGNRWKTAGLTCKATTETHREREREIHQCVFE